MVDCYSCDDPEFELDECPASERECGHHCNHVHTHDSCCWCGTEWGEGGVEIPKKE